MGTLQGCRRERELSEEETVRERERRIEEETVRVKREIQATYCFSELYAHSRCVNVGIVKIVEGRLRLFISSEANKSKHTRSPISDDRATKKKDHSFILKQCDLNQIKLQLFPKRRRERGDRQVTLFS